MTTLYTIGSGRRSAESFFETLRAHGVARVLDVRRRTGSQLAGFAKGTDLAYLLRATAGIGYRHWIAAAPDAELLRSWRAGTIDWPAYGREYLAGLERDRVLDGVMPAELGSACLLCAEPNPERCHRRLLAEELAARFPVLEVVHL